jgi:hypothetical protein
MLEQMPTLIYATDFQQNQALFAASPQVAAHTLLNVHSHYAKDLILKTVQLDALKLPETKHTPQKN